MLNQNSDNRWPLLASKETVGKMVEVTERTVDRKVERGQFPQPIKIGGKGSPRWRLHELEAWIHAGCPAMDDWKWPAEVDV